MTPLLKLRELLTLIQLHYKKACLINGEDVWLMVGSKKAKWAAGSDEEGDAVDTYETDWDVEETDEE